MSSIDTNNVSNKSYMVCGTETTKQILELCRKIIDGKYVYVILNDIQYGCANIPEFLLAIRRVNENIEIFSIYNELENDIQKIALKKSEQKAPEIETLIEKLKMKGMTI